MQSRIDVDVIAKFQGSDLTPLMILWEDGRKFKIDTIVEKRKANSLKAGGSGMRFKILVKNRIRFLFYDTVTHSWFIEGVPERHLYP